MRVATSLLLVVMSLAVRDLTVVVRVSTVLRSAALAVARYARALIVSCS